MSMCVLTPRPTRTHNGYADNLGSILDCAQSLLTAIMTSDFHHSLVTKLLSTHFTDSQIEAQRGYVIAQGHPANNRSSPTQN